MFCNIFVIQQRYILFLFYLKDAEIARLRKEVEEAVAAGEEALSGAKSKAASALADAADEVEAVKKAKAKSDKEKVNEICFHVRISNG